MVVNKYTGKYRCVFMYLTYALETWKNIQTMEYYSSLKKEGSPDTHCNLDEPWGHCAQWNEPVTKDKHCRALLCEVPRGVRVTETRSTESASAERQGCPPVPALRPVTARGTKNRKQLRVEPLRGHPQNFRFLSSSLTNWPDKKKEEPTH